MKLIDFMKVKKFGGDRKGIASVELALIAPIFLIALVFGMNIGVAILEKQRVRAAAYSAANYFQDVAYTDGLDGLRPSQNEETGEEEDGDIVKTAQLIIQDTYGQSLSLDDITIEAKCGCPNSSPESQNGFDESKPFYSTTDMSSNEDEDICPSKCGDDTVSRVIAEISVSLERKDLFGKEIKVSERVVTRVR